MGMSEKERERERKRKKERKTEIKKERKKERDSQREWETSTAGVNDLMCNSLAVYKHHDALVRH